MMPGSKIVLPSSNVDDYTATALRSTISHIVNPTSVKGGSSKEIYKIENCPSWWPKDVLFSSVLVPKAVTNGITAVHRRKILAAFLEKCPEQYTISPPVDQQNSASTVETDQPEYPAVGTKRARTMPGSKIVFPSSDVEKYTGNILQRLMPRIANSKGWGRNFYTSDNRPYWWPKDVAFAPMTGNTATGIVTTAHRRKVLAAFLEKCPEQYTISPGARLPSSRRVRVKRPVREVSPQSSSESFSESDQEEPVGMNQTPPTGAYRTRSVGAATISTAAQHANPKLILPSLCANDYYQPALISLLQNILNPQRRQFIYSSANCPSWWPTDVPFIRAEDMEAKDRTKVLTAFLEKCPDQYTISPPVDQQNSASIVETDQPEDPAVGTKRARRMSGSKIVLPSSDVEEYTGNILRDTISHIANPKDMEAKDRTKVLTAILEKCPEQYTISPPVDQQNSVSTVETDQPDDTIVDVQMNANESDAESDASIPSDPEDLVNSLEQHLLDSRKRRLEAERKVEELTEEVKRLREERKYIGSIVKRSRLHH
ncbi:uncharacterized protein LOC135339489 isoform X2 [Halichondria panicea]|uniref:uncharacterized protein LOC135339489 isoform X2 n=1 Tax=Halichondria panicea TaxID=6063 RepID=UPI00312B9CE1